MGSVIGPCFLWKGKGKRIHVCKRGVGYEVGKAVRWREKVEEVRKVRG